MLLAIFLFSCVDAIGKLLTVHIHPLQVGWTRQLGIAVIALYLIARRGRGVLRTNSRWLQIARAATVAGASTLIYFALQHVPLADATAVLFVGPFMITVVAAIFLKEPVGFRRWITIIIGFAGTLLVVRPGMGIVHPAIFFVFLTAAFFAARQIIARILATRDPIETTIVYTGLGSVTILSIPLLSVWQTPDSLYVVGLCCAIALIAGVAEICMIKSVEMTLAVVVAPVMYTMIVWSVLIGLVIFKQVPDLSTIFGAGIIIGSGIYSLYHDYQSGRGKA